VLSSDKQILEKLSGKQTAQYLRELFAKLERGEMTFDEFQIANAKLLNALPAKNWTHQDGKDLEKMQKNTMMIWHLEKEIEISELKAAIAFIMRTMSRQLVSVDLFSRTKHKKLRNFLDEMMISVMDKDSWLQDQEIKHYQSVAFFEEEILRLLKEESETN